MIQEYKAFAIRGNFLDMAVGIVFGGAFATIASSLVANVFAPRIGLATSGVDLANLLLVLQEGQTGGPYLTLEPADKGGAVTLSHGVLLNSPLGFFIVTWIVFFCVKGISNVREKEVKRWKWSTRNLRDVFRK